MTEKLKNLKGQIFITALCYIGIGIFFSVASHITVNVIIFLVALAAGVLGLIKTISFFGLKRKNEETGYILPIGVLLIIASVFFFINPEMLESIVYVLLGFAVVVGGLIKMQMSIEMKDDDNKRWITAAIAAVVMTVCGLVALFAPFSSAGSLIIMIGISMIVSGAFDIFNLLFLLNKQ